MLAKKTSKNQLTLPKKVADQFPGVDYFEVRVDGARITLIPVRPRDLSDVWHRLDALGISDKDVRDAVTFARRRPTRSR
jgi:hypothetical protein